MDNSVMGGGLLPGSASGILELDSSIHRHQPAVIPHSQNHHHLQQQQQQSHHLHPAMALSSDHPMSLFNPSPRKSTTASEHQRGKLASSSASDEDDDHDPSFANDDSGGGVRGKKGGSSSSFPCHRMKWTDEMVRLLISVVACVGDGGVAESCDGLVGAKRKASGGVLQKKGKWKTVSKMMMEKGCYVAPQQCEDKFNDLNKRYKRLNEILGRGRTCQVVQNPSLLDSINVSPKAKDDVRKILSSKHLFYREMCAYHNGQRIPNSSDIELPSCALTAGPPVVVSKDVDRVGVEEEEEDEENVGAEGRSSELAKVGHESFQVEMDGVLQDQTRMVWEQRDWFRKRALQLHEERVEIQTEAFELEKRRFKWLRFCSKKDRELERMRLENERSALENERMMMQVKQKEMELEMKKSEDIGGFAGFRIDGEQ